ncbi:MAG: hypothetical protein SGCHY_000375 [Lobulomycetales sp.]
MDSRAAKLAALRNRRQKTQEDNLADTRREASTSKKKQQAAAAKTAKTEPLDPDDPAAVRRKALSYTIQEKEEWDAKLAERAIRNQPGFSTYAQMGEKKFQKLLSGVKPDLELYEYNKRVSNVYRDANSLEYATDDLTGPPAPESVDKMAADLDKQLTRRAGLSKRRKVDDDEDITYINERNRHFNRKVSRAFDAYTKDIKASFERGTALD